MLKTDVLVQDLDRCYHLLERLLTEFAFDKHTDLEIRTNMVNLHSHNEMIKLLGINKKRSDE